MTTRPAVLAGRWYPSSAAACDAQLSRLDLEATTDGAVAAVVPHAGWVYSGDIAFSTLAALAEQKPDADLVIVFGGHMAPRDTPRLLVEGAFETPYGKIDVAGELAQDIAMGIGCDLETPEEYYEDNAVEVQMPIIKKLWPGAKVITLGVPPTKSATSIGRETLDLAKRRGFERIVIVGSTDLTHYGPNYDYQPRGRGQAGLQWVKEENDPKVIAPMTELDAKQVLWTAQRQQNACCPGAVMAAIGAAHDLGAQKGVCTAYTTSWDVLPQGAYPTSFVGYAGMLFGG